MAHPAAEVLRSGLDSKKSMRGVLLVKLRARMWDRWAGQHQYLNRTAGLSQGYCTSLYISMTFRLDSVLGRRRKQTQRHRLLYGKGGLESFSLYKGRHELDTEEVRLLYIRKLKSGKNQSGKWWIYVLLEGEQGRPVKRGSQERGEQMRQLASCWPASSSLSGLCGCSG